MPALHAQPVRPARTASALLAQPARPARSGSARLAALLGALLCLAGQLAGLAHVALVSHVRCLEHQALEHAELDAEENQSAATSHADSAQRPAAGSGAAPSHGHDHCLAGELRRRDDVLPCQSAAPIGYAGVVDDDLISARSASMPPAVPLHRLAPKRPPPA